MSSILERFRGFIDRTKHPRPDLADNEMVALVAIAEAKPGDRMIGWDGVVHVVVSLDWLDSTLGLITYETPSGRIDTAKVAPDVLIELVVRRPLAFPTRKGVAS